MEELLTPVPAISSINSVVQRELVPKVKDIDLGEYPGSIMQQLANSAKQGTTLHKLKVMNKEN